MPPLPSPSPLARARRASQGQTLPARRILGPPGPRLRKRRRVAGRNRSRAGSTRRQQDGENLHRGPKRRLALRSPLPLRLCKPASLSAPRRRASAPRLPGYCRRAMRAAEQQALAGRTRHLQAVSEAGARDLDKETRGRCARPGRFPGVS